MCTSRNIEDVLKRLPNCRDTREMRQLLDDVNACSTCPDDALPPGYPGCLCEIELKNRLIHYAQKTVQGSMSESPSVSHHVIPDPASLLSRKCEPALPYPPEV